MTFNLKTTSRTVLQSASALIVNGRQGCRQCPSGATDVEQCGGCGGYDGDDCSDDHHLASSLLARRSAFAARRAATPNAACCAWTPPRSQRRLLPLLCPKYRLLTPFLPTMRAPW